MFKNGLKEIRCVLQTLESVDDPREYCLSADRITMAAPMELQLEFAKTIGVMTILEDQSLKLEVTLQELDVELLQQCDFNFDVLWDYYDRAVISNLKVKLHHNITGSEIPVYLKSLEFSFENGKSLDYSKKVTVFALMDLATAA